MALRRVSIALVVLVASFGARAEVAPVAATSFVPSVLSPEDTARYRQIFAAERAGEFDRAETLFAKLTDTSLKGYVLAEHYLSSHSKRVPVATLVDWLHSYAELPIAERIYRLAVKRSTKRVRHHHKITLVALVTNIPVPGPPIHRRGGGYEDVNLRDPPLLTEDARVAQEQINAAIRGDQPDQAMAILQTLDDAHNTPGSDIARLAQRVAASYFAQGMDQQAYDLATREAQDNRKSAPLLDWNAGLAAFRMGNFADAATHFEILAQVGSVPNWTRSAAGFWAARARLRAGDPQSAVTLLTFAARDEPTFYGLLAERMLGVDTQTGFSDPVLDAASFAQIMQQAPARRAVALWQCGERDDIALEMERAFGQIDMKLYPAFAGLARQFDLPNLELRASETSASNGKLLTGLFPVPQYKPDGGYTIDPALVLAVVRIESRFMAGAVSPAGARGLMQLMPATAVHIAGRGAAERLTDPTYNMTLGQRYIAELLDMYGGNLVELFAAYNAGPLKVSQWMSAREGKENDPLMFIESMRAPETRDYVKRLMMYHWMYRRRMSQPAKSLDETATGAWPVYHPPQQPAPPPPPAAIVESSDAPATN